MIAGNQLLAATVKAAAVAPLARCTAFNYRGEPLPTEGFDRFHTCDLLLRPFTLDPQVEPGAVAFPIPERPFRIVLPLTVPGFGQVFLYADNQGRGYTRGSFSEKPLLLNREFAVDRMATVRELLDDCRHNNVTVSAAARARADKAEALLKKAEDLADDRPAYIATLMASLADSLWAGEMIVVERAEQRIVKNGPRPGFLFGCNAFGYRRYGKPYIDRFDAAFNFATLQFYRNPIELVQGQLNYSAPTRILDWLERGSITPKGHDLVCLSPDHVPAWLRNLSYRETKAHYLRYVRETILTFRNRIHVWNVVADANIHPEASHVSPQTKGFTRDETVDLSIAALQAAREADPTCFRIVNSGGTWCDYFMSRNPQPWQQSTYDYLQSLQIAEAGYEAVGLQYHHSGRDLLELERNLETFSHFDRPIHITQSGMSSSPEIKGRSSWWGGGAGGAKFVWHGEQLNEDSQAQWLEWFYKIAFSKPYVEAIAWWNLMDLGFIPNDGLLHVNFRPKPAYDRLLALQSKWREEGILPPAKKMAEGGL